MKSVLVSNDIKSVETDIFVWMNNPARRIEPPMHLAAGRGRAPHLFSKRMSCL